MRTFKLLLGIVAMVMPGVSASVAAQNSGAAAPPIVVTGERTAGPQIKGVIAARNGDRIEVVGEDGASMTVTIDPETQIRTGGGLFPGGLIGTGGRAGAEVLINGLPVTVKTWRTGGDPARGELVASQIVFKKSDLKLAKMIQRGTSQRFADQSARIDKQSTRIDAQSTRIDAEAAATEALRGRLADIDKYTIKRTTNVHFASGKAEISNADKADLCATASFAQGISNALILVVGYTDATGSDDLNQALSEKRAGHVINYLQQACGWKPWRMLSPTGMAKADPLASNDTPDGKAQNRRVAVNVLVSKSVDGL
jgi:outer membrane protein OmpA-like peptidoglycan-associated protein